jgi:hypothetical protein
MTTTHTPEQLLRFERELSADPALVKRILETLPPVEIAPERIIRTSHENLDVGIARAIARAAVLGEVWRIEIES